MDVQGDFALQKLLIMGISPTKLCLYFARINLFQRGYLLHKNASHLQSKEKLVTSKVLMSRPPLSLEEVTVGEFIR